MSEHVAGVHRSVRYRFEIRDRISGEWELANAGGSERLTEERAWQDLGEYLAWRDRHPQGWRDRHGGDARQFTRVVKVERSEKVTPLQGASGPGSA